MSLFPFISNNVDEVKVNLNDLVLDKDDFLISYNLADNLSINDKVVLLRIDDKFIILDKVVSI